MKTIASRHVWESHTYCQKSNAPNGQNACARLHTSCAAYFRWSPSLFCESHSLRSTSVGTGDSSLALSVRSSEGDFWLAGTLRETFHREKRNIGEWPRRKMRTKEGDSFLSKPRPCLSTKIMGEVDPNEILFWTLFQRQSLRMNLCSLEWCWIEGFLKIPPTLNS